FRLRRLTGNAAAKRIFQPLVVAAATLLKCSQGEGASAVHRNWLVQRHEGLKRRVRARPTDASKIAVRRVKGLEGGIRNRPISESIKGAPMAVGSLVFRPNLGAVTDRRLEHEGGQWREHASAANRGIQQPAGR